MRFPPGLGLFLLAGTSTCFFSSAALAAPDSKRNAPSSSNESDTRPPMDIVFAIDCSGSMGGVIETAKQKIWDIVNEAGRAKPSPHVRIGLLAYGNGSKSYRKYDLSDDLDTVYQHLMSFKDEGWSDEFVGEAIQKSVDEMNWSSTQGEGPSLRTLYVVGNETARQGPIDYSKSAPHGRTRGVFINAIYCGSEGGQETWRQFAAMGGGNYLEIAGNGGSVMLPSPYDAEIAALNVKLNGTYIPYGSRGEAAAMNQRTQDSNAMASGGAYANAARSVAKASAQYRNAGWDLVDKSREKGFDLAKIPDAQLPVNMRSMTLAQRREFLSKKQNERAQLQKQLGTLGQKRGDFLKVEMKKKGRSDSFDRAVNGSLSSQAAAGGFSY